MDFFGQVFFNAAGISKMLMNEYKHSEVYMVNICPT
jgi:hypothetical protein